VLQRKLHTAQLTVLWLPFQARHALTAALTDTVLLRLVLCRSVTASSPCSRTVTATRWFAPCTMSAPSTTWTHWSPASSDLSSVRWAGPEHQEAV
jgi:hypothetical protein